MHKKQDSNPLRKIFAPKVVSEPDPETGHYNPFPVYPFTGSLRPVYPLSPRSEVPTSIPHPDYAKDGMPRSEQKFVGRNNITLLNKKEQDGMRKVCRYAREVLDIAAREVKPGVTTDHIDKVVHKACMERNVSDPLLILPPLPPFRSLTLAPVLPLTSELRPLPQIRLHIPQRSHLSRYP